KSRDGHDRSPDLTRRETYFGLSSCVASSYPFSPPELKVARSNRAGRTNFVGVDRVPRVGRVTAPAAGSRVRAAPDPGPKPRRRAALSVPPSGSHLESQST